MNREELLAEKILQLDWLYSVTQNLSNKAKILAEMIELARKAGIEVISDEDLEKLLTHVFASSLAYDNPALQANALITINKLKSDLIAKCIEANLIKSFKEIPVAIAGDNYADANEID